MRERLLQLIWKFGIFNKQHLCTTQGESILIINPGMHNHGQGPDFLNAKLIIGKTCWVGNIELHIKASCWLRHGHIGDPHYKNVILHVVWEEDKKLAIPVPVLELRNRISAILLSRFRQMMNNEEALPCNRLSHSMPVMNMQAWRDRLAAERLTMRKQILMAEWSAARISWQDLLWRQLLASFGMPFNQEAFRALAIALPYSLVNRLREDPFQLEALLLGQAGLLNNEKLDEYSCRLAKEYRFLVLKFGLTSPKGLIHSFGCRPSSSPSLRLSQMADFLHRNPAILHWAMHFEDIIFLKESLNLKASAYWERHVAPGKPATNVPVRTGFGFFQLILINALIPFLSCYADYHDDAHLKGKLLHLMEKLPAEKNKITKMYIRMGMKTRTSIDSQALVHLYKEYCLKKRCLQCAIGLEILKGG